MSCHRPPASACWQSLLAVPLLLFVFLLVILYFLSPDPAQAQTPQIRAAADAGNGGVYDHETMAPGISVFRLEGSIEIDGVLNEAVWGRAEPFTEPKETMR